MRIIDATQSNPRRLRHGPSEGDARCEECASQGAQPIPDTALRAPECRCPTPTEHAANLRARQRGCERAEPLAGVGALTLCDGCAHDEWSSCSACGRWAPVGTLHADPMSNLECPRCARGRTGIEAHEAVLFEDDGDPRWLRHPDGGTYENGPSAERATFDVAVMNQPYQGTHRLYYPDHSQGVMAVRDHQGRTHYFSREAWDSSVDAGEAVRVGRWFYLPEYGSANPQHWKVNRLVSVREDGGTQGNDARRAGALDHEDDVALLWAYLSLPPGQRVNPSAPGGVYALRHARRPDVAERLVRRPTGHGGHAAWSWHHPARAEAVQARALVAPYFVVVERDRHNRPVLYERTAAPVIVGTLENARRAAPPPAGPDLFAWASGREAPAVQSREIAVAPVVAPPPPVADVDEARYVLTGDARGIVAAPPPPDDAAPRWPTSMHAELLQYEIKVELPDLPLGAPLVAWDGNGRIDVAVDTESLASGAATVALNVVGLKPTWNLSAEVRRFGPWRLATARLGMHQEDNIRRAAVTAASYAATSLFSSLRERFDVLVYGAPYGPTDDPRLFARASLQGIVWPLQVILFSHMLDAGPVDPAAAIRSAAWVAAVVRTGRWHDVLQPSNVHSRAAFTALTGTKLPRGLRASQEVFSKVFRNEPIPLYVHTMLSQPSERALRALREVDGDRPYVDDRFQETRRGGAMTYGNARRRAVAAQEGPDLMAWGAARPPLPPAAPAAPPPRSQAHLQLMRRELAPDFPQMPDGPLFVWWAYDGRVVVGAPATNVAAAGAQAAYAAVGMRPTMAMWSSMRHVVAWHTAKAALVTRTSGEVEDAAYAAAQAMATMQWEVDGRPADGATVMIYGPRGADAARYLQPRSAAGFGTMGNARRAAPQAGPDLFAWSQTRAALPEPAPAPRTTMLPPAPPPPPTADPDTAASLVGMPLQGVASLDRFAAVKDYATVYFGARDPRVVEDASAAVQRPMSVSDSQGGGWYVRRLHYGYGARDAVVAHAKAGARAMQAASPTMNPHGAVPVFVQKYGDVRGGVSGGEVVVEYPDVVDADVGSGRREPSRGGARRPLDKAEKELVTKLFMAVWGDGATREEVRAVARRRMPDRARVVDEILGRFVEARGRALNVMEQNYGRNGFGFTEAIERAAAEAIVREAAAESGRNLVRAADAHLGAQRAFEASVARRIHAGEISIIDAARDAEAMVGTGPFGGFRLDDPDLLHGLDEALGMPTRVRPEAPAAGAGTAPTSAVEARLGVELPGASDFQAFVLWDGNGKIVLASNDPHAQNAAADSLHSRGGRRGPRAGSASAGDVHFSVVEVGIQQPAVLQTLAVSAADAMASVIGKQGVPIAIYGPPYSAAGDRRLNARASLLLEHVSDRPRQERALNAWHVAGYLIGRADQKLRDDGGERGSVVTTLGPLLTRGTLSPGEVLRNTFLALNVEEVQGFREDDAKLAEAFAQRITEEYAKLAPAPKRRGRTRSNGPDDFDDTYENARRAAPQAGPDLFAWASGRPSPAPALAPAPPPVDEGEPFDADGLRPTGQEFPVPGPVRRVAKVYESQEGVILVKLFEEGAGMVSRAAAVWGLQGLAAVQSAIDLAVKSADTADKYHVENIFMYATNQEATEQRGRELTRSLRHDHARLVDAVRRELVVPAARLINESRREDGDPPIRYNDVVLREAAERIVRYYRDDMIEGPSGAPPAPVPVRSPAPQLPPPAAEEPSTAPAPELRQVGPDIIEGGPHRRISRVFENPDGHQIVVVYEPVTGEVARAGVWHTGGANALLEARAKAMQDADEHSNYLAERIAMEALDSRSNYDTMKRLARSWRGNPARLADAIIRDVVIPQTRTINRAQRENGDAPFHFDDAVMAEAARQLAVRAIESVGDDTDDSPPRPSAPPVAPAPRRGRGRTAAAAPAPAAAAVPAVHPAAAAPKSGPRGKSKTFALDDDVAAVLRRAKVDDMAVTLPPEQLDRKLYDRVAAALEAAGAKWKRGAKAHVFQRADARDAFLAMLDRGSYTVTDDLAFFGTPDDLAARIARLAGARPGAVILEPSAGEGAIVQALLDLGAQVVAVEYDPGRAERLAARFPGVRVVRADFLALTPTDLGVAFDGVAMNPPFSLEGQPQAAIEHVTHAVAFAKRHAPVVAVMPPGARDGTTSRHRTFHNLVIGRGKGSWMDVPAGTFKGAGTNIATVILKTHA